jgi:signal peptidase
MNKTRLGRRLLGAIALVLLLALVVPFVIYGVPQLIGADASYTVVSGSMVPVMQPGDAVIVEAKPAAQIGRGDIITFTRDGQNAPITHRVVGVVETDDGQRAFVTQGDANEEPDQLPVTGDRIIGQVILTIPLIGHVVLFANTQFGFILLVAIPLGLLVLNEGWSMLRRRKETPEAPTAAELAAAADGDEAAVAAAAADTDDSDDLDDDADDVTVVAAGSDDGSAVLQFTKRDLNTTLLVLGLVSVYAGIVVWQLQEAWTVTALVAAVGSFLFTAAIRHSTSDEGVAVDGEGGLALVPSNRIVKGVVPESVRARAGASVDSLGDLVAMARNSDAWIVTDGEDCYLTLDGTVFTCPVPDAAATDEAETDEAETDEAAADEADTDDERIDEWFDDRDEAVAETTDADDDDDPSNRSVFADGGSDEDTEGRR